MMSQKNILAAVVAVQLALIVFLFSAPTRAEQLTVEHIKGEFVSHLQQSLQTFELCEVYDKGEDKKAYLDKALGEAYTPGDEALDYKEMFVKQPGAQSHLHLGVVVMRFDSAEKAAVLRKRLSARKDGDHFDNTKILTKFKVTQVKGELILVYSETFLKDPVKSFIDARK